jgi:hypothetical protein
MSLKELEGLIMLSILRYLPDRFDAPAPHLGSVSGMSTFTTLRVGVDDEAGFRNSSAGLLATLLPGLGTIACTIGDAGPLANRAVALLILSLMPLILSLLFPELLVCLDNMPPPLGTRIGKFLLLLSPFGGEGKAAAGGG